MTRLEAEDLQIDGVPVGDDQVRAKIEAEPDVNRDHRLSSQDRPSATSGEEWTGRGLRDVAFDILLDGPVDDVEAWAETVLDLLDREDPDHVPTLETGTPILSSGRRLPLRLGGARQVSLVADEALVRVEVRATVQGLWPHDAGTYCAPVTGSFTKTATGWERDDGTTFTDAEGPQVRLPDQYTGYPLFTRRSDRQDAQPPLVREEVITDEDGVRRRYQWYDLSDFLLPELPAEGDGAWFSGCQVPTPSWLHGTPPMTPTFGVGSRARADAQLRAVISPVAETRSRMRASALRRALADVAPSTGSGVSAAATRRAFGDAGLGVGSALSARLILPARMRPLTTGSRIAAGVILKNAVASQMGSSTGLVAVATREGVAGSAPRSATRLVALATWRTNASGGIATGSKLPHPGAVRLVPSVIDDFNEGDISGWSGDTLLYSASTDDPYEGSHGLQTTSEVGIHSQPGDGLGLYPVAGDHFKLVVQAKGGDEANQSFQFGRTDDDNTYRLDVDWTNSEVTLVKVDAGNETTLANLSVPDLDVGTGYWTLSIRWGFDGKFDVDVYDTNAVHHGNLTPTDTTYTDGGIGCELTGIGASPTLDAWWDWIHLLSPEGVRPGDRLYLTGGSGSILEYRATTAFDISTLSLQNTTDLGGNRTDAIWDRYGVNLFVVDDERHAVDQYRAGSAWDITSLHRVASLDVTDDLEDLEGVAFKPDGTLIYITGEWGAGFADGAIARYRLETPYDLAQTELESTTQIGGQNRNADLGFKTDGEKLYTLDPDNNEVEEFVLTTPWDETDFSFNARFSTGNETTRAEGIGFNRDGTKLYVVDQQGDPDKIYEYTLSTAWDISTAALNQSFDIGGDTPTGVPLGLTWAGTPFA